MLPFTTAKIQRADNTKCWQERGRTGTSYTATEGGKCSNQHGMLSGSMKVEPAGSVGVSDTTPMNQHNVDAHICSSKVMC